MAIIPELAKFRAKYPGYDDISDDDLAARLAKKYPAYRDLPAKIEAARNSAATDMPEGQYAGPQSLLQGAGAELAKAPKPEPGTVDALLSGLLTNRPTRGVAGAIGRMALPTIGGMLGAGGGTVLGFGVGAVPGAGIGSAAGESARQALVSMLHGNEEARRPGQIKNVLGSVAKEGATGAISQGLTDALLKGVKLAAPQAVSLLTKVPEKYTKAAVEGKLVGAPTKEAVGATYEKLLAPFGFKGLDKSLVEATGKNFPSAGGFNAVAENAANALRDGTLTPKTALWGRQAIGKMEMQAKLGNPEYQGVAGNYSEVKKALDAYLEEQIPGFKEANKQYFRAKGREAFNSVLPRNKNGTPDVARSLLGFNEAVAALALGHPGALAILPAQSPKVMGALLNGVNRAAPVAVPAAPRVAQFGLDQLLSGILPATQ